jgi:hypothetical protein
MTEELDEKQASFTEDEIIAIRSILEQEKRMSWLWSSVRVWITWGSGVLLGAYALWSALKDVLHIKA